MTIYVAGEKKDVADGLSVAQLVTDEKLENPDYVTVSLNDEFVDKDNESETILKEGDTVEFLFFMGGGR